jgi:hypothetical protein
MTAAALPVIVALHDPDRPPKPADSTKAASDQNNRKNDRSNQIICARLAILLFLLEMSLAL